MEMFYFINNVFMRKQNCPFKNKKGDVYKQIKETLKKIAQHILYNIFFFGMTKAGHTLIFPVGQM